MITSTTNNNASGYTILYAKANEALKNAIIGDDAYHYWVNGQKKKVNDADKVKWIETVLGAAQDVGLYDKGKPINLSVEAVAALSDNDFKGQGVNSLEEYYGILKTLAHINSNFQIMPLYIDEQPFNIDANTRTIEIPSSQNTYAVKGDHMAEYLFFSIKRYFDIMDFNDTKIYIQWKINDVEGNSEAFIRDITSRNETLIFGWALDDSITTQSGTLEFSIRFFKEKNGNIIYSYSTLPVTIQIKDSLEIELKDVTSVTSLMEDLLINFPNYNTDTAGEPIFNVNLNPGAEPYFNLTQTGGTDFENAECLYEEFNVQASSPNVGGLIGYDWRKITDTKSSLNSFTSTPIIRKDGYTRKEYTPIEIDDDGSNVNDKIIYNEAKEVINFIDDFEATLEEVLMEQEAGKQFFTDGGSTFIAQAPGTYYCEVTNNFGIRSNSKNSDFITIPGPAEINFDEEGTITEYYLNDYEVEENKYLFDPSANLTVNYSNIDESSNARKGEVKLNIMPKKTGDSDPKAGISPNTASISTIFTVEYENQLNNYSCTSDPKDITVYNPLGKPNTCITYTKNSTVETLALGASQTIELYPTDDHVFTFSEKNAGDFYLSPLNAADKIAVEYSVYASGGEKVDITETNGIFSCVLVEQIYYITTKYSITGTDITNTSDTYKVIISNSAS